MAEPIVVTPGQSEAPPLERAAQARRIAEQLDRDGIDAGNNGEYSVEDRLHAEATEMRAEAQRLEGAA